MNELVTRSSSFYQMCESKTIDEQALMKLKEEYSLLKEKIKENENNPEFNDWLLLNSVFYEMIGNILDNITFPLENNNSKDYSDLINTVVLFNKHYQNIVTGNWQEADVTNIITTLNGILDNMNQFYQKLFFTENKLYDKYLPTVEKQEEKTNEEYLTYIISAFKEGLGIKTYPLMVSKEIENNIVISEEDLQLLKDRLTKKDNIIYSLQEEKYDNINIISSLSEQNNVLQQQNNDNLNVINLLSERNNTLEQERNNDFSTIASLSKQNNTLQQVNNNLSKTLSSQNEEINKLNNDLDNIRKDNQSQRSEIDALKSQITELKRRKGAKYYYVRHLNVEKKKEEIKEPFLWYLDTPFIVKEGSLTYHDIYLKNGDIPLFNYDNHQVSAVLFMNNEEDILTAINDEMIDEYYYQGYQAKALKDQYDGFYDIKDVKVKELRRVA